MRRHAVKLNLCSMAVLVIMAGCQASIVDLVPVAPGGPVSYAQDVQPILQRSCGGGGCHIYETTNGVNLTTYLQVTNSVGARYRKKIVQPGNADGSPLVDKLKAQPQYGAHMPPGGRQLTAAELGIIRAWIDDGAQNN